MDTTPDHDNKQENSKIKSFLKRAKWLAGAIVLPLNLKSLAAYLTTWYLLWPAGMVFFPRAEDVLKKEGLRPEIVQELAPGKRVYIRTDNFWGKAHALLDRGFVGIPFAYRGSVHNDDTGAFAQISLISLNTVGLCEVYFKASKYKKMPAEYGLKTLLHEIRHCSEDNAKLLDYRWSNNVKVEGDADYHAINILAREKKQPELREYFLREKAWGIVEDERLHDTALYLDAQFNNRAVPSKNEIDQANQAAHSLYTTGKLKQLSDKTYQSKDFSPLLQRRLELYYKVINGKNIIEDTAPPQIKKPEARRNARMRHKQSNARHQKPAAR